jgi:hypothetical protein
VPKFSIVCYGRIDVIPGNFADKSLHESVR